MELIPLTNVRRAVVTNYDAPEQIGHENDQTTTFDTPFGRWFYSIVLMAIVTPSICNLLIVIAMMAASYYYSAMLLVNGAIVLPSFWDRTMWAIGCASIVCGSYAFLDGIAARIEESVLSWTFGKNRIRDADIIDAWQEVWHLMSTMSVYVIISNVVWYLHSTSRLIMKMLLYMSLAFYVSALLWSQVGVPYSLLPSHDSPIVGQLVAATERVFGPLTFPLANAWTRYTTPTASQQTYPIRTPFDEM